MPSVFVFSTFIADSLLDRLERNTFDKFKKNPSRDNGGHFSNVKSVRCKRLSTIKRGNLNNSLKQEKKTVSCYLYESDKTNYIKTFIKKGAFITP